MSIKQPSRGAVALALTASEYDTLRRAQIGQTQQIAAEVAHQLTAAAMPDAGLGDLAEVLLGFGEQPDLTTGSLAPQLARSVTATAARLREIQVSLEEREDLLGADLRLAVNLVQQDLAALDALAWPTATTQALA